MGRRLAPCATLSSAIEEADRNSLRKALYSGDMSERYSMSIDISDAPYTCATEGDELLDHSNYDA